MTLPHRAQVAAQRMALDFTRYPTASPDHQAFRAFISPASAVILDVGANDGQFAQQCRRFGFTGEDQSPLAWSWPEVMCRFRPRRLNGRG